MLGSRREWVIGFEVLLAQITWPRIYHRSFVAANGNILQQYNHKFNPKLGCLKLSVENLRTWTSQTIQACFKSGLHTPLFPPLTGIQWNFRGQDQSLNLSFLAKDIYCHGLLNLPQRWAPFPSTSAYFFFSWKQINYFFLALFLNVNICGISK